MKKKKNKETEVAVPATRFIKHKRKTKQSKLDKVKRFFVVLKLLMYDTLHGFFVFGGFPISIGDVTEILSVPFYALTGYLTHLKVDKIW